MGWQADDDGTIIKDRVSALRIMAPENLTADPTATTQSEASGNINIHNELDFHFQHLFFLPLNSPLAFHHK